MSLLRSLAKSIERFSGVRLLGRPVLRRVFENTAYLSVGQAVSRLLTFLVLIYVARALGPEGYGSYSTIVALVGIFLLVASFGLENVVIREGARYKGKLLDFVSTYFPLKVLLAVGSFAALIVLLLVTGYSLNFKLLALAYGVTLLFTSTSEALRYVFNITQKMRVIAIAGIGERLFFVLLTLLLLPTFGGIKAVIAASIGSIGLLLVWYLLRARKELGRFPAFEIRLPAWWKLTSNSKWFAASDLLSIGYSQLNVILLSSLVSMVQAGLFSSASNLYIGLLVPVSALNSALLPVSSIQNKSKSYFEGLKRKLLRIAGLSVIASVVLSLLSGLIIRVLFGEAFMGAAPVFALLAWLLPVVILGLWYGQLLTVMNKQRYFAVITAAGAVINLGLSFVLIPELGAIGAAISFFAATLAMVGAGWFFAARFLAKSD